MKIQTIIIKSSFAQILYHYSLFLVSKKLVYIKFLLIKIGLYKKSLPVNDSTYLRRLLYMICDGILAKKVEQLKCYQQFRSLNSFQLVKFHLY